MVRRPTVRPPPSVTVPRLWPGSTVVCLGGGPSLTPEDVDYVRGKACVIAVNDAYRLAPWADVLYACDPTWWKWHHGAPSFVGLKYALVSRAIPVQWPAGVQVLKNTGRGGLELDPAGLRNGSNSGYQAMNLAVHLGAKKIVLLGYDMQRHGTQTHWFGDHPTRTTSNYPAFVAYFTQLAPLLTKQGIVVMNCSRRTALTCFPCHALTDVLPERLEAAS